MLVWDACSELMYCTTCTVQYLTSSSMNINKHAHLGDRCMLSCEILTALGLHRSLGQHRRGLLEDGVGAEHTADCHADQPGRERQGRERAKQNTLCMLTLPRTPYLQPLLISTELNLLIPFPTIFTSHPHLHPSPFILPAPSPLIPSHLHIGQVPPILARRRVNLLWGHKGHLLKGAVQCKHSPADICGDKGMLDA